MGKKKEDDEGILFYLLLALGMHLSGQNLAWKNTAAVVCSRETMVAVICFVGKLLEPALVSTGDKCWMRSGATGRVRCRVLMGRTTQRGEGGEKKTDRKHGGVRIFTYKRAKFANC